MFTPAGWRALWSGGQWPAHHPALTQPSTAHSVGAESPPRGHWWAEAYFWKGMEEARLPRMGEAPWAKGEGDQAPYNILLSPCLCSVEDAHRSPPGLTGHRKGWGPAHLWAQTAWRSMACGRTVSHHARQRVRVRACAWHSPRPGALPACVWRGSPRHGPQVSASCCSART